MLARPVEQGACGHGHLMLARGALFERSLKHVVSLGSVALRAYEAVGPLHVPEVLPAGALFGAAGIALQSSGGESGQVHEATPFRSTPNLAAR